MWYSGRKQSLESPTSPHQKGKQSQFYHDDVNSSERKISECFSELSPDTYEIVGNLQNGGIGNSDYDVLLPEKSLEPRQSISNVKRVNRNYGKLANSGLGMRESLVAFREGVPGAYSGFKLSKPSKQQSKVSDTSSVDVKKLKMKLKSPHSETFFHAQESSHVDMEGRRNILIDNSGNQQETGIRYYDPEKNSSMLSNAVVLPISSVGDLSESDDDIDDVSRVGDSDDFIQNDEIYDVIGSSSYSSIDGNYMQISPEHRPSVLRKPPLPPRNSFIFDSLDQSDLEKDTYIQVDIDMEQETLQLPPLLEDASSVQIKRHQVLRGILDNEKVYMKQLQRIVKVYQEPLIERLVINADRIKVIFKYIDEIVQCHQLFNIALSDRLKIWNEKEIIGDVIHASFSKSMAVKAYSSFVCNFTIAMDSIKETCKLVPTFLNFLKYRLYRSQGKHSLYDLMRQPLERIPQLVILLSALLRVTPLTHPDHLPLQMALTQLECLSEMLSEKRKDSVHKYKVYHLDSHCIGMDKPLASKKRYYVRHDDMLLCKIENGEIVQTKLRRLFLLNDLLVCASHLNKQKQAKLKTNKRYKIKWCLPVNDVEVVEFGSGITVDIHEKTTTIKYSNIGSSPRPGYEKSSVLLEDLQHDLAIIGEISGKVASLRRTYRFIDEKKVKNWYNDMKEILEREVALANMHWIELSIPLRDFKEERLNCLFNVHSPQKKIRWTAALENAKLRLSDYNNPGWYLQEENMSVGETALLRRTVPLLTKSLPLFIGDQKFSIQYSLEIEHASLEQPLVWVFSGNDHVSYVTVLKMNMKSQPHVTETFEACESRVCCAEVVPSNSPQENQITVLVGTTAGIIIQFNVATEEKSGQSFPKLKDAITSIRYTPSKIFAGMANGTVACYAMKNDGRWDISNPTIICLSGLSVMSLTHAGDYLWCACGSDIYVIHTATLATEKKLQMEKMGQSKTLVRHVISYGIGVWISLWKSAKLQLLHAETFEHLQTISIATPINRMKDDIDGRIQNINVDKIYVTSLLAKDGLLWVGVDQGLILTYPLPKLGGIPTVAGLACVSFHGHQGPVKHLHSFQITKISDSKLQTDHDNEMFERRSGISHESSEANESGIEPVYYVVEPEHIEQQILTSSFEENSTEVKKDVELIGKLDNISEANEDVEGIDDTKKDIASEDFRRRVDSYDSDEDIHADQEFSFIENNKSFKNNNTNNFNNFSAKDKSREDIITIAPELKENGFAELMERFDGFYNEDDGTNGTELTATNESKFFMHDTSRDLNTIEEESYSPQEVDVKQQPCAIQQADTTQQNDVVQQAENKPAENNVIVNESSVIDGKDSKEIEPGEKSSKTNDISNVETPNVTLGETSNISMADKNRTTYESPVDRKTIYSQNSPPVVRLIPEGNTSPYTLHEDYQILSTNQFSGSDFPQYRPNKNENFETTYDTYKALSLPKSPEVVEDLNVSPSAISTPKTNGKPLITDSEYTPLLMDDEQHENNISASGVSAFERDMSLDEHAQKKLNNYASLEALSKRNEENDEYLLNPKFVCSIGTGHVDFRKRSKSTSGLDFFRSFSSSGSEPLLLIWKLA